MWVIKRYRSSKVLIITVVVVLFSCTRFDPVKVNKVQTGAASAITQSSGTIEGNILEKGDHGIDQHGFYYSIQGDPTSGIYEKTELGSYTSTGSFSENITGLEKGTTYYYRAYVIDSEGMVIGEVMSFTTVSATEPIVSTTEIASIEQTSAVGGGDVTDDGGASVTAKGVCWSTSQNPTISDSCTNDGSGPGTYTSYLSGLSLYTTYNVRAYATNSAGTAYGDPVSFTTLSGTEPIVSTTEISSIEQTSAVGGGDVTDNGGASVTAKGICWSTSQNPTISDSYTNDGSGPGTFTSYLTGLSLFTTYYVRAYATNSAGTTYGDPVSFTTDSATEPIVSTTGISSIEQTSAVGGGDVTDNGGASVTAKGVCWSTSQNPTVSDSYTNDGNGLGTFTSNLTGLSLSTTYYVRAYATNSAGTAYGDPVTFTTDSATEPIVSTTGISSIEQTSAVGGGDVTDDGGASVTAKGVCWSTSQNPTISDSYTNDGSGLGTFTSYLTGLSLFTTYYVRAYATNSAGTAYGDPVTFTTDSGTEPTVSTTEISSIKQTSAVGGGDVTDDGGASVTAKGVCWSTSQNPTISDSYTNDGSGLGTFASNLTGLSLSTTYYVRAYATNSAGTAYGDPVTFKTSTVTDSEGNVYKTVEIGSQTWMAENLKTKHYNDGSLIPLETNPQLWTELSTPAYCWYNNDEASYKDTYGAMYNYYTIETGKLCPSGWHVPTDDEWKQLEMNLGMIQSQADATNFRGTDEGGKMKESGTSHWASPNTGATNESGLKVLPAGGRYENSFNDIYATAYLWSSSGYDSSRAWYRGFGYSSAKSHRFYYQKNNGFSVRCLQD